MKWKLGLGGVWTFRSLVVTVSLYMHKGLWMCDCLQLSVTGLELQAKNTDTAKAEALSRLRARASDIVKALSASAA